jgi:hypothetical protein
MKNHTRYFIVSMLFFASSLNYADRATVSLTKTNLSGSRLIRLPGFALVKIHFVSQTLNHADYA